MLKNKLLAVSAIVVSISLFTNISLAKAVDKKEGAGFRILKENEMKSIKGADHCQNVDQNSGNTGDDKSPDPVILNNGDLVVTVTDVSIPALGPDLEIARTYNSQVTSRVEGWSPEKGAGPWVAEDGEYHGHGDRTVTLSNWSDFTLILDMKTVEAGIENSWDTARVNFRYTDKNNTYYLLIHTNGTLELARLQNGQYTWMANGTNTFNHLASNNIKIETTGGNIKVYVNSSLEIDHTDGSPLTSGKIALEARFSHASFDNVSISDGVNQESHDFNLDDNETIFGRQWTSNLDVKATEYPDESVVILREDGKKDTFTKNPDSSYTPPFKVFDTLTKTANGFTLRLKNGTEYHFDTDGKLIDITDRNANALSITYGSIQGKLKPVTVTGQSGRTLSLDYGTNGLVSKITDPIAREILYTYDASNHLISVTDPRGNARTYAYNNASHTLATYTDREGNIYNYTYYYNNRTATQTDPVGNITTFDYLWDTTWVTNHKSETTFYHFFEDTSQMSSVDDLLGNTEYYTYDADGNRTSVKDKNGNTTTFTYDTKGNMLTKTDPLSNTTSFTYEPNFNQVASITEPHSNLTLFDYDTNGNLIKITDASNNITTFEYDTSGNLIKTTDALNNITTYTYDQYGNRTSVTDALNNQTQFAYDLASRVTSVTDANNHTTAYEYDANDNLTKITDALGNITTFTYDKNNQKITETDAASNTTTYEYNYAGDVTKITDAQNNQTLFAYDLTNYMALGASNKLSQTDANNNVTSFEYDKQNQLIKTTDAKGNITQFFYDPAGKLIKITDAKLHDTHYTYDAANRLIKTTYHDTLTEEYTYDNNGNILTKKDKKGQIINYAYDALNRLATKTYPDLSTIEYTYDALSRLLTVTDITGTITHSYDAVGRLTSVIYPGNFQVSYQYNAVGNRTQLTYPNSDIATYAYDEVNNLVTITTPQSQNITFSYDNLNRRTGRVLPNGTGSSYSYDSLHRLTNLTNSKGIEIISSFDYTYDNVGNRLSMTNQAGNTSYTYDTIYQLTNVTKPDLSTTSYTHDPAGNRTDVNGTPYTTNTMNQYTQVGQTNYYDYDSNGSMISKTENTQLTTYTYDYENRLTQVVTPSSGTVSFTYDPMGRLIKRDENGVVTKYIYDGDRVIAEADSTDAIKAAYLYGTSIDEVLTMSQFFEWGVGIWYYNYDGVGSVSELTDWQGTVIEKYSYGEYGSFTIEDGSGNPLSSSPSGNRFYFTGREWDFLTGLYFYRARYYDPALGRFLQTDPIGYNAGDMNLYRYVWNNPLNWVDPLGLKAGDSYSSADAAAADAMSDINPTSISEGKEYAGQTYKNPDGSYSYTEPRQGTKDSSNPGSVPYGKEPSGAYHTHGSADPGYDNENFSPADKAYADRTGKPIYLATPEGKMKKYDPNTGKETEIPPNPKDDGKDNFPEK